MTKARKQATTFHREQAITQPLTSISLKKKLKSKVAFVHNAGTALRVEETPTTPTTIIPSGPTTPTGLSTPKSAIKLEKPKGGRQPASPQCNLPPGYRSLRYGYNVYSNELADKLVDAYYAHAGSLTRACRDTGVRYTAALTWRETIPQFKQALNEVDSIIQDEAHSQFMERVLTTWEPNPTWKLTYFKKHFPQYSETKKSAKFVFNITDTLIKPDIIEAEVIPPKQLESSNESRPKQTVETSSHPGKVS